MGLRRKVATVPSVFAGACVSVYCDAIPHTSCRIPVKRWQVVSSLIGDQRAFRVGRNSFPKSRSLLINMRRPFRPNDQSDRCVCVKLTGDRPCSAEVPVAVRHPDDAAVDDPVRGILASCHAFWCHNLGLWPPWDFQRGPSTSDRCADQSAVIDCGVAALLDTSRDSSSGPVED